MMLEHVFNRDGSLSRVHPKPEGLPSQTEQWICTNPECKAAYAEYVNGCPKCYHEKGSLFFRVECQPVENSNAGR